MGANPNEIKTGDEITGIITNIQNVVIEGNTYYYITLQDDSNIYKALITIDDRLPFMTVGNKVTFMQSENSIIGISTYEELIIE